MYEVDKIIKRKQKIEMIEEVTGINKSLMNSLVSENTFDDEGSIYKKDKNDKNKIGYTID